MKKDIDVSNISVKLGKTIIVKNVDVSMESGKILAIVGSSGGGKSTLARCLTGQIKPVTGGGTVLGFDIIDEREKIQQNIGYIPQVDALNMYLDLSPIDNIRLIGSMYDSSFFSSQQGRERIRSVLDILDIEPSIRSLPTKRLSGGERKRVSIAMSIVTRPRLIFLDEPTTGLDEHLKNVIFNYLKKINKELKITLCIVSHNLLVCELVDKIMILKKGESIEHDDPKNLLRSLPSNGVAIKVKLAWREDIHEKINKLSFLWKYLYVGRNLYKLFCHEIPTKLDQFVQEIYDVGLEPSSIVLDDANLLDYFLIKVK